MCHVVQGTRCLCDDIMYANGAPAGAAGVGCVVVRRVAAAFAWSTVEITTRPGPSSTLQVSTTAKKSRAENSTRPRRGAVTSKYVWER